MTLPSQTTSDGSIPTVLAYERTHLAQERTLMAWIRTSTSLISFGFSIYKVFQALGDEGILRSKMRILSPRAVGLLMIALGLLGLAFALVENRRYVKSVQKVSQFHRSFAPVMAGIILALGGLAIISAVFDI